MKRIVFGILAATLALLVIAVPVLATYWAYLVIEETNGSSYSDLPVIALRNVTQLANYGIITSSGLDTRVLTGDGAVLPHMLADDRVLTVTDLVASEKKQLIFYTGATSLSSFPIIVGYGGNITTSDVPELEPAWVGEILASGYFDASAGTNKSILYKEEAFNMSIPSANTIRVAALNSSGEQWALQYTNFTTGDHDVYIMQNSLEAALYVDDFNIAKDTENLINATVTQVTASGIEYIVPNRRQTVYANGIYWVLGKVGGALYCWTSTDGKTWDAGTSIPYSGTGVTAYHSEVSIWEHDDYIYVAAIASHSGNPYSILYRRGYLNSSRAIDWTANWTRIHETDIYGPSAGYLLSKISIATDYDGYPIILGTTIASRYFFTIKSSNKDTWAMAGGYPQSWSNSPVLGGTTITGYPTNGTDKVFTAWTYAETNYAELCGRYCESGSWFPIEAIVPYSAAYNVDSISTIADGDDNVYVVWHQTDGNVYLRIRYSDDTWSSSILLSSSGTYPCVFYNQYTEHIYVTYQSGSYTVARTIFNSEISPEHIVYTKTGTMTAMAYPEESMGVLYSKDYLLLELAWLWNDNDNDWYWMMNNVMPYADLLEIAVDGVLHCHYEPVDIIHGNTLPDLSPATGNDGIINWGENPSGVSAYITPIQSDETIPTSISPNPNGTAPGDMVGPTGQPGSSQTLPTLPSHPLYSFLAPLAALSGIPLGIMWILLATFIVVMAMIVFYRYVPHLLMTVLIGGGLSAFFYAMGIYPFWVLIIFVIGAIAIIVSERMPSID